MGGSDVYCAICGAYAGKPDWRSVESGYDRSLMDTHDISWMGDVRIICENIGASSTDKYVSVFVIRHDVHCLALALSPISPLAHYFIPRYTDVGVAGYM